jgi:plasmid maintenance system antidote protein VapI
MNVLKLKGRMVECGMNVERLAEKISIDRATLYRKLNKSENITVGEAQRIKDALELTREEASVIFFE